jgi:pimeloyl-ACP methyl ester carboxylesterase
MTDTHSEKLVYTESGDGYVLEGALFVPADGGHGKLPVVWMHGFTGRFYEQHQVAIGRRLAARGHVFVTGNNRGHHFGANVANMRGGPNLWAGAWWEKFEDCPFDYSAWIGFTVALGFSRVILIGHSLGAMKAVYYMGTCQDERVAALVSASGPVRLGQWLHAAPERLALAERLVAEGRGHELLADDSAPVTTSAQTLVSRANTNMDVYGLDRADAPVGQIRCPVLFVLGSAEPNIATAEDLPILSQNARSASRVDTLYVEGANHIYYSHELDVADGIGDWIDQLE